MSVQEKTLLKTLNALTRLAGRIGFGHGKWLLTATILFMGYHLASAQKQPAAPQPSAAAWKSTLTGTPDDYVGADVCSACHVVEAEQFAKTKHAHAAPADTQYASACESCHGPGRAHADGMAEAGDDVAKIAAAKTLIFAFHGKTAENSARCMACHISGQHQELFNRSEHILNGVGCDQCHAAHLLEAAETPPGIEAPAAQPQFFTAPRLKEADRWPNNSLLRQSQPDVCFGCHGVIQAQFALPTHHRVPEGFMKCTDCHNPHGSITAPMLKETNWQFCVNCHIDKRGPFLFEHASVLVEGCVACHSPHGTVTRNLLLRREGRFLCLQCHVDPQAANVPHGRLGFQTRGDCVRCHVAIHGSNFSEFFLN
jgi:predicted CXXCH cytochrome family protein